MKKFWSRLAVALLVVSLLGSGCALFRNPFAAWTKAENKVEAVQKKVEVNQDAQVSAAKNYVFATGVALHADPSTNRAHEVASDLNEKAGVVLGPPPMEEVIRLKEMVKNLIATNNAQVIRGEEQLAAYDNQVVALQNENVKLSTQLEKAQDKLTTVGTANAGLAQKWATLTKIFWWIIYGVIAMFIIKIAAVFVPPPYNSFIGILAVPFGLITKAIHAFVPEAKKVAGVVHQDYQIATQDLITTIQKLKEQLPEKHVEISEAVFKNTDSDTSARVINEEKQKLGLVS